MLDSDILIRNSIFEGKSMTILEAMSFVVPIVTAPVGGISEITIRDENTEYTNGKSLEISDAIMRIAADYKKIQK